KPTFPTFQLLVSPWSLLWAAWKTLIEERAVAYALSALEGGGANWYNPMSQINVLAGAALNFNEFREGKANRCDRINFGPLYWRWLA
ncbi:MAG TPA: hypothetical protein VJ349_14650, partial [Stellaceae bacterium]|nr:hypothetical protein [Stellaceae bacterium]